LGVFFGFCGSPQLLKAINVSLACDDFSGLGGFQLLVALAGKTGGWALARRFQIQYFRQEVFFAICVHCFAVAGYISRCAIYLKIDHDPLGFRNFRVN
jgi:hypothetical protein